MVDAHLVTDCEHATSSTWEVATAEVKVWKKEFEFPRRTETAWQSMNDELERNFSKKATQVALAKLLERVSNAEGRSLVDELSAVTMLR
jgi:hypothetical protein